MIRKLFIRKSRINVNIPTGSYSATLCGRLVEVHSIEGAEFTLPSAAIWAIGVSDEVPESVRLFVENRGVDRHDARTGCNPGGYRMSVARHE